MNATASLRAPLHVRRGPVIGLSVAVAAVAVVALATTWALRVNSDTSSAPLKAHPTLQQVVSTITPTGTSSVSTKAPSPTLQEIVSTITPPAPTSQSHVGGQRYVAGIMAMSPEQLVATFGTP